MASVNYATNISQRTPCVLILDSSSSMSSPTSDGLRRIDLLNEGIEAFHSALREDELALSRVQVSAICVGGPSDEAEILMDWTDATEFQPFRLFADGFTPLGAGMRLALQSVETQKISLRSHGISYTRPWIFVLTDGEPTDDDQTWSTACSEAGEAESGGKVEIFPVGIGAANVNKLSQISRRPPIRMEGIKFRELFVWLSASLGQISRSVSGEQVDLPPTDPWSAVKL